MKLLVTGARGFLGFSVAEVAWQRGWKVCGIGRSAQAPEGWLGDYSWADVAQSDLTSILDGFEPDIIFHGAGSASVRQSFTTPIDDLRGSTLTFAGLLEAVRRSSSSPVVIFPSSAAVYGNPIRLPISEEDATIPISPYGFHKLQCEMLAREYAECFGLNILVVRLFSVFGPRQKRLLVWELLRQFSGMESIVKIQGTGEETRDFLLADDAANIALDLAVCCLETGPVASKIVNVASGIETSVIQLARTLQGLLSSRKTIEIGGGLRMGDPRRWRADVTRAKETLSKFCFTPLEEGLKKLIISHDCMFSELGPLVSNEKQHES